MSTGKVCEKLFNALKNSVNPSNINVKELLKQQSLAKVYMREVLWKSVNVQLAWTNYFIQFSSFVTQSNIVPWNSRTYTNGTVEQCSNVLKYILIIYCTIYLYVLWYLSKAVTRRRPTNLLWGLYICEMLIDPMK